MIDCINLGYYLFLVVDQSYFANLRPQRNQAFPHEILVYGYDSHEQIFYVADFFESFKYSYEIVSFNELTLSYNNLVNDYINAVHLLHLKEDVTYNFDLDNVIELLNDYLFSRNTSNQNRMNQTPKDWIYGMNIYDFMIHYLNLIISNEWRIQVRSFHVLWDHKKCMLFRIKYLEENGFIKSNYLFREYESIENMALLIRNLSIKFAIAGDMKIIVLLEELSFKEKKVLHTLVDELVN